jgi:hypothetical protein
MTFFSESITNGNIEKREREQFTENDKQIKQEWLWEDRRGKDVHPVSNVDK